MSTITWHIGLSGKPSKCQAHKRPCPFTHFTTDSSESKTRVRDAVASGTHNQYGSFTPSVQQQDRVKDEVVLSKAVAQGNFNMFASITEKHRAQDAVESNKQIESVAAQTLYASVTDKEHKSIQNDVQQAEQDIKVLQAAIQQRLQNPDWDENSAELVSMFYVRTLKDMKKKPASDSFERTESVYQEKSMLELVNKLADQADDRDGKLFVSQPRLEKYIVEEVHRTNSRCGKVREDLRVSEIYEGFFKKRRSAQEVSSLFKASGSKKAADHFDKVNTTKYNGSDDEWGTYHKRVAFSDIENI